MDGRVKTLHPLVHGGLLGVRDAPAHAAAMAKHGIGGDRPALRQPLPVRETVASGADFATSVENIDIGGPAMIRSAAKNHGYVAVCTRARGHGRGPGGAAGRRRHHAGAAPPPGRARLRPHRRLRRRHLRPGSPASSARPSRSARSSPASGCRPCATARTPTRPPPSTAQAPPARGWPPRASTRARRSATTTWPTPTPPSSWWPSSIRPTKRRWPSSSTPTPAAWRWAAPCWRPTSARCSAIQSRPSAASWR